VNSYVCLQANDLLLAVVAVGVRAAAVARVDVARGGHVEGAVEVVARALAVELAGAEVDVRSAVAVHPRLGLKAVGAGIAGVEGDGLEDGEHFCASQSSRREQRDTHPQNIARPCPVFAPVAGKYSLAAASVCSNCVAGKFFGLPEQTSNVCNNV
jgi:hypothetical protein